MAAKTEKSGYHLALAGKIIKRKGYRGAEDIAVELRTVTYHYGDMGNEIGWGCDRKTEYDGILISATSTDYDRQSGGDLTRMSYDRFLTFYFYYARTIGEQHARTMAEIMGKVSRGLQKIDRERGYTDDFGEYVVRVCGLLGIKTVIMPTQLQQDNGDGADRSSHWMTPGEAVNCIRSRVYQHNHRVQKDEKEIAEATARVAAAQEAA